DVLDLSHNQITSEGLEIILKVLAATPSVSCLLLNHNHIAFDRYFCQKVVEPLVKEARLTKLDLSMNFIYPGEMLERKSIQGRLVKIVRDKIHSEHKIDKEREYYCQLLLERSPIVTSCYQSDVRSLLDPNRRVDKDSMIISLCAFKTTLPPFGEH